MCARTFTRNGTLFGPSVSRFSKEDSRTKRLIGFLRKRFRLFLFAEREREFQKSRHRAMSGDLHFRRYRVDLSQLLFNFSRRPHIDDRTESERNTFSFTAQIHHLNTYLPASYLGFVSLICNVIAENRQKITFRKCISFSRTCRTYLSRLRVTCARVADSVSNLQHL